MNISPIIELFKTPTCIVLSVTILVLVSGLALKNLHIKCRDFELNAESKKKKHKK